jgi:protein-disulfide isomerase
MASILARFAAPALVLGLLALPAIAQQKPNFTREEIEAIIREYIVKNPEILQEAAVELERRQAEAQAEAVRSVVSNPKSALYESPHHMVIGNPKGDVTLVEFFDYNCGFCKRGLKDMMRLVESDKNLRIVLKDFPILSPGSRDAAAVAYAYKKQASPENYWKFHFTLMGLEGRIGKDEALGVVKDLGGDMKRLEADLAKSDFEAAFEETRSLAGPLGITGTPTYVVVGARGYDTLAARIANYRKCKKAEC